MNVKNRFYKILTHSVFVIRSRERQQFKVFKLYFQICLICNALLHKFSPFKTELISESRKRWLMCRYTRSYLIASLHNNKLNHFSMMTYGCMESLALKNFSDLLQRWIAYLVLKDFVALGGSKILIQVPDQYGH